MEVKDRNTEAATVADELKAQRRNLTADEWKLIRFSEAEIQELETLAKHEAGMDAPRHIVPIFERHMEEIGSLIPDNIELGQDVYLYAFAYDTDIGGMLQDMAQYSGVIDDAAELHNRIAAHGDKWLLIAEGMRRAYWYYHGCMIQEMGGKEYADALAANIKRGIRTAHIILDTVPQTAGKTEEELEAERGKNLSLLREEERNLLNIPADSRHRITDAFMRWHLGEDSKLKSMEEMILQSLIGRQTRCLEVSRKRAEAGANGGKKKSKAKADAVRANGKLGGRPASKPKQNQSKTKANTDTDSVSNSPSLDSILSYKNILPDTDTVSDNRRVSVSATGTGRSFDPWKCVDDEIRYNHTAVEVLTLALGKGAWRRAVDEAGEGGEEGIKELFITFRAEIRAGEDVENRAAAFTAKIQKNSPLAERRKKISIYGSGKIGIPKRLEITDADDYENRF